MTERRLRRGFNKQAEMAGYNIQLLTTNKTTTKFQFQEKHYKVDDLLKAPGLLFNRKDDLHNKFFDKVLGKRPEKIPCHYLPSTEKFVEYITSGIAYGMLMDQQCEDLIAAGELVELFPTVTIKVDLYWHRWNFSSAVLDRFSKALIRNAKAVLT